MIDSLTCGDLGTQEGKDYLELGLLQVVASWGLVSSSQPATGQEEVGM